MSYQWKVAPHARLGYQWNTNTVLIPSSSSGGSSRLPGGFQYDIGADWSATKQITVAGDFLGSEFIQFSRPGTRYNYDPDKYSNG